MNSFQGTNPQYILGLDIGIASVGWCLLRSPDGQFPDGIIDLGVRVFEKAELPKTGESLNAQRRLARSMRRRLRRRSHRLQRLRRLFRRERLLTTTDFHADGRPKFKGEPWRLRAEGLDRVLEPAEWAETLYHLIKNRGYLSTRKTEATEDAEAGQVLEAVKAMRERLEAGGWRTIGEMAWTDHEEFGRAIRNKAGSYKHCFDRNLLRDEMELLFSRQRELGSQYAPEALQAAVVDLLMTQRPALAGDALLKMLGPCTFEPEEYRAPRASWTAERFVWLQKLNHVRIIDGAGKRHRLADNERRVLMDKPYELAKLTYAQARKALDMRPEELFVGLVYRTDKNPESKSLFECKGWHESRKALGKAGLENEWKSLSTDHEKLDRIAWILTVFKEDKAIRAELRALELPPAVVEALLGVSFSTFSRLSFKAMCKIVPYLERGLRYDEACEEAGYTHYRPGKPGEKTRLLPPVPQKEVRNPVVIRALTQARKVVNAIVREYGSPLRVQIELARDLSKPFKERSQIRREQDKWQTHKQKLADEFVENLGTEPGGKSLLKYRFYKDQAGKCAYSLQPIDLNRLNEPGYVEIDHILPYSRTFDDSLNNKVLVLGAENRNKGNQTPWEYFGRGDEKRWEAFEAWVKATKTIRQAKRNRLLKQKLDESDQQDFMERNLNDTRYIARFLKNFVEANLRLVGDRQDRVVVVSGSLTSFLRARYGLIKAREEGDLHHAMDAAVVAASTRALIKRLSDYSRREELAHALQGYADPVTGEIFDIDALRQMEEQFPAPWPHFRKELEARLSPDPEAALRRIPVFDDKDLSLIKPVLVSRAPIRRGTGQGHLETIRSAKRLDKQISYVRKSLTNITMKDLESMHGRDRDWRLHQALKAQLEAHEGDAKKAFAEPFYKPSGNGKTAPLVCSIKVEQTQKSGIPVRGGVADAASMARVDVYRKTSKFFLVPVYVWQLVQGIVPKRAVIAYKPEEEWEAMDETSEILFSLYPNDLVSVKAKSKEIFGYFVSFNRSTGAIDIATHDRNPSIGKGGVFQSVGVKSAREFTKYQVDPLGCYWPIKRELPPWAGVP